MRRDIVQEIKERLPIEDVVGQYVQLKQAGKNLKANCPFHSEKTPSFIVSPDRGTWHCFGSCNTGGDVVGFVMKYENLSFPEAVKELAEKAGIPFDDTLEKTPGQLARERLIMIHSLAAKYYTYLLTETKFGALARDYLDKRGIRSQTREVFSMGYSLNSWDGLLKFLQKRGFKESELKQSGLFIERSGGGLYDRFRGRLMFPIHDIRGNVIAFSGRVLKPDEKEAKYINSPETELYKKRESLFNIHRAKDAIKKHNNVVIVEGEFDVIAPYQAGISQVVAIKGTALSHEHLTMLKRLTNNITFALDTDEAGFESLKRSARLAEDEEFNLHVLMLPPGAKDVDEALTTFPLETKKAFEKPSLLYDALITVMLVQYPPDTVENKVMLSQEVAKFLIHIGNPIVKSHYIGKLAAAIQTDEESIKALLKKMERQEKSSLLKKRSTLVQDMQIDRKELLEKQILGFLAQGFGKPQGISEQWFAKPVYQKLLRVFLQFEGEYRQEQFVAALPSELQVVFDEVYLYASTAEGNEQPFAVYVQELHKTYLKKRMQELFAEDTLSQEALELAKELKSLEKRAAT